MRQHRPHALQPIDAYASNSDVDHPQLLYCATLRGRSTGQIAHLIGVEGERGGTWEAVSVRMSRRPWAPIPGRERREKDERSDRRGV